MRDVGAGRWAAHEKNTVFGNSMGGSRTVHTIVEEPGLKIKQLDL